MNQQQWNQPGQGTQHQQSAPQHGQPGPQQQWGQPGPGPQQWQQHQQQPAKKKRLGPVLMIIGAIIGVLAIVAGILGGIGGIAGAIPSEDEMHAVTQPLQVTLSDDQEMGLWGEAGSGVTCSVLDEAGEMANMQGTSESITLNDLQLRSIGKWSGAGTYTVECDGEGGYVGPPLGVGALVGGVGGIIGAVFLGIIGGTLFIVGLIVWLVQRKS